MENLKIRPVDELDEGYILSSWLRTYHHNSYFCKKIKKDIYYPHHEVILKGILSRPTTRVWIACNELYPEVVLSYLVYEEGPKQVIHWVYTKDAFKKIGLAKELFHHCKLDPNQCYFTHWTYFVDDIIDHYPEMVYDPYRI
jgi:hypothetical protein